MTPQTVRRAVEEAGAIRNERVCAKFLAGGDPTSAEREVPPPYISACFVGGEPAFYGDCPVLFRAVFE